MHSQRRRQGFFDQVHPPGTGFDGRIDDGPLLHLRYTAGHTDDHTGLGSKETGFRGLAEQGLQKTHGHFMIGDHAALQGPHGHHVSGGPAQHIPGGGAYLQNSACIFIHGHHRRLPDHDALAVGIDEHVGRTQVHTQIVGEKLHIRHLTFL